jgi:protein-disulfide isomerase
MADFDAPMTPLGRDQELSLGPANAPVQIYVFLDVACPYSKSAWEAIASIVEKNSPHVRAALRHYPIKSGSDAAQVHVEAAARVDNDRAVTLLQSLFDDPPGSMGALFGDRSADQIITDNIGRARLDRQSLEGVIEAGQLRNVVISDAQEAQRLGFTGTPGLVINGVRVYGSLPQETYQHIVDAFMPSQSAEARDQ